jgi:uncharacterized protein (DUF2267 family)
LGAVINTNFTKIAEIEMTKTTLPVFQQTLQKSEEWLDAIMTLLDWQDQQQAYKALRAVLHTLRDRLTVEEATDLAAQLPMLLRGLYFDGWNPSGKPVRIKTVDEFVDKVNTNFPATEYADYNDPEEITRAVLKVIASHVSKGEINDIVASLPDPLRELWD